MTPQSSKHITIKQKQNIVTFAMVLYTLQHTPSYLAIKHSKDTKQSELPHSKWHLVSMSEHPERTAKSAPQIALAMTTSSTNQILAASTTSINQLLVTQTNKHLAVSTSSPNKQTIQHAKDNKESWNLYLGKVPRCHGREEEED